MKTGSPVRDLVDVRRQDHGDGIVLGWCSPGTVDANFADSLVGSALWDRDHGARIWGTIGLQGGPRIVETRSQIVDSFLRSPQLKVGRAKMPDWLLMIDSDMAWEPGDVHRIVDSAVEHDVKIMGALCIGGGYSAMFPTLYSASRDEKGELVIDRLSEWPRDQVVKVDATGAAFLLVHREVYLTMARTFAELPDGSGPEPHPWFIEGRRAGNQYGEDIGFCIRAKACGFEIKVDTSIKTSHFKRFAMNEAVWDAHQADERTVGFEAVS